MFFNHLNSDHMVTFLLFWEYNMEGLKTEEIPTKLFYLGKIVQH